MDMSYKIDTELTLALDIPEEEREKSLNLNTGYDSEFREWQLIVKYIGDIIGVANLYNAVATPLFNGYAIVRIRENYIAEFSDNKNVLYIEKPKNLVLQEMEGISASCINRVRLPDFNLQGEGTIVAVIDSGIDIYHPDFRNDDNTTRILNIWDQNIAGNPPNGFYIGTEYTMKDINEILASGDKVGTRDLSGHGTAVAGVACGNGRGSNGTIVGVAPKS